MCFRSFVPIDSSPFSFHYTDCFSVRQIGYGGSNNVMGLPGAVYDVIADEDIYTGDRTLRAAKDTVVETLTTGEDGTAQNRLL